jgi:hypothetical protein
VLAAGDFDSDGFADLAIGVPHESLEDKHQVGAVNIIFGSSSGLTSDGDQFWHQDSSSIEDTAEDFDGFGRALASGDFDEDGFADLAIGVPDEDLTSENEGAVNVLYGSSSGLASDGDQFWHQDRSGIENTAEGGDFFGSALAAGDFDGDGQSDLAAGAFGEDIGEKINIGAVNIIYGSSSSGLTSSGDQFWTRDSSGVEGTAESEDHFGSILGTGDYNGDENTDLAIGVPSDRVGTASQAGAVNVLYGSDSKGLTSSNDQLWSQARSGIEGTAEEGDQFGNSLSKEETSVQ